MKKVALLLVLFTVSLFTYGQNLIQPEKGFTNDIGNLV